MGIDDKLRNARTNADMTQEQTAEKINVSRQTISNWERGKSLPDTISLIKLSDLYQISLDELVKGDSKVISKIEKDTNAVKSNQAMMRVGWVMLIFSVVFSIWNNYGGSNLILQFISTAAPWVMAGIGVACVLATRSAKKEKNEM